MPVPTRAGVPPAVTTTVYESPTVIVPADDTKKLRCVLVYAVPTAPFGSVVPSGATTENAAVALVARSVIT